MVKYYCPKCKYLLKRLPNKKVGFGYFWMCSNIKNGCNTFFEDEKGKPIEGYKHHCPFCDSGVKIFKGKYGLFWSCVDFKNCGKNFKDNDGVPIFPIIAKQQCVVCESPLVLKQSRKGNAFWGCNGYPKCKEIYNDIGGEPSLDGVLISIETKLNKED
jgi:ssDNA-binding Zn-finger/Zn-ribbon topoisomerase 1